MVAAILLLVVLLDLFKGQECTGSEYRGWLNADFNCPMAFDDCRPEWVGYQMYDRAHSQNGQYIEVTNSWNNLTASGYNPHLPVAVIIPGYAESINGPEIILIKNELLKSSEMSVILVDWLKLAPYGCYFTAVFNIRYVGKCLAELITAIGKPSSGLHVIGFSAGGHVSASAADFLAPYKIPRITGLDPAFPLFWGPFSQRCLKKDDGQFVDVIHTNAFYKGHFMPLGHVDFYVNGGSIQPGCSGALLDVISCSHDRNPYLYAESINTKVGFWGCKVASYLDRFNHTCRPDEYTHLMGYHVNQTEQGIMILNTAAQSPYAQGKPSMQFEDINKI